VLFGLSACGKVIICLGLRRFIVLPLALLNAYPQTKASRIELVLAYKCCLTGCQVASADASLASKKSVFTGFSNWCFVGQTLVCPFLFVCLDS
jgi:hypothetical protein